MGSSEAIDRLDELVDLLVDYDQLVSGIEFVPPGEEPSERPLVERCLERIRTDGSPPVSTLSDAEQEQIRSSALVETVGGYVFVPLRSSGDGAFAWLPLLDILADEFELLTDRFSRILSRARTDCEQPLKGLWAAAFHAASILALRVSMLRREKWLRFETNDLAEFIKP